MRFLAGLAIGVIAGAALSIALRRGLSTRPEGPGAGADPPGEARVAAPLASPRGSSPARPGDAVSTARSPASASTDAPGRAAGEAKAASLESRLATARRTLALLDQDAELREIYHRHDREENGFPHWQGARFLADAGLNPAGATLSDEERLQWDLLYSRAFQRVRALDLRRQLAIAEAIGRRIDDDLLGRVKPGEEREVPEEDALSISLPDNLRLALPLDEFPEIRVLEEEQKAAAIEWLLDARRFFAGRN